MNSRVQELITDCRLRTGDTLRPLYGVSTGSLCPHGTMETVTSAIQSTGLTLALPLTNFVWDCCCCRGSPGAALLQQLITHIWSFAKMGAGGKDRRERKGKGERERGILVPDTHAHRKRMRARKDRKGE